MAALSIKIVGTAPARFDPPNQHADPGDVISWNNTTNEPHQIWQLIGGELALHVGWQLMSLPLGGDRWDPILPNSSSPAWTVPNLPSGTRINYRCLSHAGEIGAITVN